ncbi:heavy metal translocating P-type ATPase [Streptomyces sp. NPDC055036]
MWGQQDLLDVQALVTVLKKVPRDDVPAKASRSVADVSTGEVARLVVGGAVLALVGMRRLLGRTVWASPRAAGVLGVVALFTGMPFFKGAARSLTGRRDGGTDVLVTAATLISLVLRENIVALVVLWLLNIGEFLQSLTLRRTRRAIEELLSVGDDRVWLVRDGVEVQVALDEVVPEDHVAVYEHQRVPVDGTVVKGEALVDQAAVTGESIPIYVGTGTDVYAGTIVTSGSLTVRATLVGRDTTVGRIITRVEEAQADRAPIQTVASRFTRRFVPISFALAGLVYVLTRDARRAMTMLLVACPCAAGLATPTAISAAIGNGARRGTLIKGGTHLESVGQVTAVVFDKTGTLTLGRPLVTSVVTLDERYTADEVLSLAASGEMHARHPLADAIVRGAAEQRHLQIPLHEACEVLLGMGVRAELNGNRLLVGSPALLRQHGLSLPEEAQPWVDRLRASGETAVCLAHDSRLIGMLGLSDTIRDGASTAVRQLADLGVHRIILLTGDSPEAAEAVADVLAVHEIHAHALPEMKLQLIRDLKNEGHIVAMVGDGTNDAPALALADVGITLGAHSSHVALETADIALASSDLRQVVEAVELSRHTLRVVRQNYALAIGVNLLGLLAGAGGSITPVAAALLHNTSSITVVANSARLVNHTPHLPDGASPGTADDIP